MGPPFTSHDPMFRGGRQESKGAGPVTGIRVRARTRRQNGAASCGYADRDRWERGQSAASRALPSKKPAPLAGTLRSRQKAPRAPAGCDLPRARGLIPFDEPRFLVGGRRVGQWITRASFEPPSPQSSS
jgi:hypothetical protein